MPAQAVARIAREFAQNADDTQGRSMILMGAGTNHWFHSDMIYRSMLMLTTITGCQGRQRRRLGALRRPGEVSPHHRLGAVGLRPRLVAPAAPDGADRVLVSGHRSVALRQLSRRRIRQRPGQRCLRRADLGRPGRQVRAAGLDAVVSDASIATRSTLADDAKTAGQDVGGVCRVAAQGRRVGVRRRGPGRAGELPARLVHVAGQPASAPRPRATSISSSTCSGTDDAVNAEEADPENRPKDVRWHEEAPTGKLDLLLTLDFRMTSSTIFSDVVLPAATWYEKHDLNTTDMHPFIHSLQPGDQPAVADQDATGTPSSRLRRSSPGWPKIISAPARRGRGAAAARHPRRDGHPARRRQGLEGRRMRAGPGPDDAQDSSRWSGTTGRSARR